MYRVQGRRGRNVLLFLLKDIIFNFAKFYILLRKWDILEKTVILGVILISLAVKICVKYLRPFCSFVKFY